MYFRRINLDSTFDKDVIQEMNKDLWDGIFCEFLDDFYAHYELLPKNYFLDEPKWGDNFPYEQRVIMSCHIHKLVDKYKRFDRSKWIFKEYYFSKDPIFAMNAKGNLRLWLLRNSESYYVLKNCYLGENTLSRC